ncbi:GNAT family N-acetyltransferase [Vibrio aphrogenes]|uniref:GNAT family N-acetyltransferase n=1 Tax=Vibrio aphrogenes TaxID=1891186 RepID=UPI000B35B75C|nr:GNAT family N-acetyltransferase [Vibrio aphrogenes]
MTINIRQYTHHDAHHLRQLFFHTVRQVNAKDYTLAQLEAWAPDEYDQSTWAQHMANLQPFIAEIDGKIVGYADLQPDGLIDHFFCHYQYQGCGIGRALMQSIVARAEQQHIHTLYSHVSQTAKPFFEHFGFETQQEQSVALRGQQLRNFKMTLNLSGN